MPQSTLTFSFLYRNFPIAISLLAISNNSITDSRCPMRRNSDAHVRVDFSTSRHFYRDFGLRGIANPNVNVSGLYFPRNSDTCATCLPLTPVVPHCLRHRRDIADRDSKLQEYSVLETPDTPNPDFFGSSDTRPKQWTVLGSSGYRVSRYRNSCCNNLELRLTKPRSTICVWIQRPSWS
jgi:hypothetical protein